MTYCSRLWTLFLYLVTLLVCWVLVMGFASEVTGQAHRDFSAEVAGIEVADGR